MTFPMQAMHNDRKWKVKIVADLYFKQKGMTAQAKAGKKFLYHPRAFRQGRGICENINGSY